MKTIDIDYLNTIIESGKSIDEIFDRLLDAAREAKQNGMTQKEAADLFSKLGDDGINISSELDGCIASIVEIIVGYCCDNLKIWEGILSE
ncbi:MAG: hypothetical protein LBI18_05840 [Planctomycetaceae bacterium]|jgi:hypothetical protein|nr:hypothetical protein [Planctomycetaceae bacterium]